MRLTATFGHLPSPALREKGVSRAVRVLHVVRQYAPAVGGLESFVACLAEQQRREGLDAQVVTLDSVFATRPPRQLPRHEMIRGVPVTRISWRGSMRYPLAPGVLDHLGPFDIVHVHAVDFFADFLSNTRWLHHKPLVLSTHGGFFHTGFASRLKRIYFATATRWSLRGYARVCACSQSDFDTFRTIAPQRLSLIENGVDTAKFADAGSPVFRPTLAFLGRFSHNKRIHLLIDLVAALRERGREVRLLLIGRDWDDNLGAIQAQIAELALQDRVEIHTGLTDGQIRGQLGRASFLASASAYEGFGLALVEGLAAGLLPLASGIASFEVIVRRAGVGCIVPFEQPQQAADEVLRYLDEVQRDHAALRQTAQVAAQQWSWPQTARKFLAVYDDVLGLRVRRLQGVNLAVRLGEELVSELDDHVRDRASLRMAIANAHTLNLARRMPDYRALLSRFLVVNDGSGVNIASRWRYGRGFPDNLNGTDFVPRYLAGSRLSLRVFLLGARPQVVKAALAHCQAHYPQHEWVGAHDGYFSAAQEAELCRQIRQSRPDLLLVAMGNPLQEHWIDRCAFATGATVCIGVGALFDFWAGVVLRAPMWMRRLGVEWMYRLAQEPLRLWRRYVIGNAAFLWAAARDQK